ncbi:MAG TPA: leucyl/phenylalanyl-tRNA--protein transferase [Gammaproteobacteria bacterium]|nr:leucyl/phenylalanyl-tRNA--protein transferase [Gammaproteobacteria bacterium]
MSELRWLSAADGPGSLPDPADALIEPNGLLAAGGSLEPEWLLASYRRGIFPWFEAGQPILWWSPNPRTVLEPADFRLSRSLRKRLRREEFRVTADRDFAGVITACAGPRRYTSSTWITPAMIAAYTRLHELGWAHSFEAWSGDTLAGGLYGVAIGQVFFGESMFAARTDASKVAFWHALRFLSAQGFEIVDCQLPSAHLSCLGARPMPRSEFLALVARLTETPGTPGAYSEAFEARPHEP